MIRPLDAPERKWVGPPLQGRSERAAANRAALLDSARAQFAVHGFAGTKTTRIASAAGLTLGALYHHFPSKLDLFLTVISQVESEVAEVVGRAIAGGRAGDPLGAFCKAVEVWVDSYTDPAVMQILLVDRPAVCAPRHDAGEVQVVIAGLQDLMERGHIQRRTPTPLARLLASAVEGAARYIGGAADPARAKQEISAELKGLLNSAFRADPTCVGDPEGRPSDDEDVLAAR